MSYRDPPGWPEPPEPGHDNEYPGRRRPRHLDAAPDAYPGRDDGREPGFEPGLPVDGFPVEFDRPHRRREQPRRRGDRSPVVPAPPTRVPKAPDTAMPATDRPGAPWSESARPDSARSDAARSESALSDSGGSDPGWSQRHWLDPVRVDGAATDTMSEPHLRPGDATTELAPVPSYLPDDATTGVPLWPGAGPRPAWAPDATPSGYAAAPAEPVAGSVDVSGKPAGRAGRDLRAAIGVGLTLGAVVIASLFVWRPAFLGVVVVAICVATWELARAVRPSGARPPLAPLLAGGVAMTALAWFGGAEALTLGLVATVIAALVWRLADGPAGYHRDLLAAVLIAVYVPFLGGFAVLLLHPEDGALRVVAALAGVVLSDTGGYVAGVLFGRHPMAPSVSPKKSWEGFAGSLAASAVGGAILLYLMLDVAPWYGAVFGLCVAAASVLGDFAESLLKRDLGIKDMSNLLPGHGGAMDRLDSVLFAAPTAYAVLALVAPVIR